MGSQDIFLAAETALWLQRKCGDPREFIGCHNITGVSVPRGDTNPAYCRDGKNHFRIDRTWRGAAGLGSMSIAAYDTILNDMQELPCAFVLYALVSQTGVDETSDNYKYLHIYDGVEVTSEDLDTQVAGMNPDEQKPMLLTMPASFRTRFKLKKLASSSIDVSALTTNDINDVAFCDAAECDILGNFSSIGCQIGFMVTDGATAVILKTVNGGGSWSSISSPFTDGDQAISKVECSSDLVIVLNAVDTAYAYSSDQGVTFTEVLTPVRILNDVFIINTANVWFVGDDGYIYQSTNGGVTVSLINAGAATSSTLLSVSFADAVIGYAVGEDNAMVKTTDGGGIWSSVTGPAPSIFPNDLYVVAAVPNTDIVFVADEQGNVYRSEDQGATWTTVLQNANLAGGVVGISIENCFTITVIGNDEDPYFYSGASVDGYMYRSIDGGASFEGVEIPSNNGLNGITACGPNRYWSVGETGTVILSTGQVLT